jgi:hypothetical protein
MQSQNQSKELDLELFLKNHPLNFLLFYGDYEVINTIYLNDGSPLVDLSMELFNQSPNKVLFTAPPNNNSSAGADNCHFSWAVEGTFVLEKPVEGWAVKEEVKGGKTTFYFLKNQAGELQPKAPNVSTNKFVLKLKKFAAYPQDGTRTIRADLTYGPLLKGQDGKPFKEEASEYEPGEYYSYGNTIFVTNNRGVKKTLPLQVDFVAGNAVLNDGTTTNSLELLIANKNWPSSNLSLSQNSEFVISFEMDTTVKGVVIPKEGSVALDTQIKGISISTTSINWNVPSGKDKTEWPVTPKSGINQFASDDVIKLNITNLVTNNSSGIGYLYVHYKNIPNYPDGQFVVPLEKTPLLYRGTQVGIGTSSLSEKLEVSGNIKATGAIKPSAGNSDSNGIMFPKDPGGGKNDEAWIRYYSGTGEACTLEISIGNDANDHIALMPNAGNVGIGTNAPSAKLHVSGNIRLSGNIENGANGRLNLYTNTQASNSDAWIELWGSQNPDSNRTGELALTGKYIDFRYNSTQSSDGTVGMRLASNGNVGIGTQAPSAKLDVNGSVKLGDGSTALNRIICGKVILNYDNLSQSKVFGKGISCAILRPPAYPSGSSAPVTGLFKITFEKSVDPEKLVVIVTPQDKYTDNIVNVESVVNDGFTIQVKDSKDRTVENSSFHFIAFELTENINKLVTT